MDFDQLTTFIEVVKLGNFSRAGQKVFRSQSAVSAQIRQLEQEYGERLLDRSGKVVRLTPAGEVLFEYAERLLTLRNESLRAVADQGNTPRGVLAIGANEATCLYVLPEVFAEYSRLYPSVQISVYRNFSRKIVQRLEDGSIDVGIATLPVKSPSLKVQPIFRDRLMVMVSANHPLARFETVSVSQIAEFPLIFPKTGYTRQILDKLFRPYASRLRITMELPSVGMIKSFVVADVGVSLISSSFAKDEVRAGQAKLIPLADVDLWRELGLIYRSGRSLPRAATAFIELIRQRSASLPKGKAVASRHS
jgi:DNA-binding transcriptional LysR family regulator